MKITSHSPEDYLDQLPEDRKDAMIRLRITILDHLPEGFAETIQYDMISYVVPKSLYPKGYHCDPEQPLPFLSIASQKNFIAFYHMGMYADPELAEWFRAEYPKHCKTKLDMGKSCIRLKKMNDIPYALLGELITKTSAQAWIDLYESKLRK